MDGIAGSDVGSRGTFKKNAHTSNKSCEELVIEDSILDSIYKVDTPDHITGGADSHPETLRNGLGPHDDCKPLRNGSKHYVIGEIPDLPVFV